MCMLFTIPNIFLFHSTRESVEYYFELKKCIIIVSRKLKISFGGQNYFLTVLLHFDRTKTVVYIYSADSNVLNTVIINRFQSTLSFIWKV